MVRPVEVGEELCHSYLHTTLPREARRQELLARWGFLCSCTLCSSPPATVAEQDSLRSTYTAVAGRWREEGRVEHLLEASALASSILGFRHLARLALLEEVHLAAPSPALAAEGAALAALLLGEGSIETMVWEGRRDRPLRAWLIATAATALIALWRLATLAAILFNFWHDLTTPYCLLLLSVTLYSKAP